jgi:hypothetical protein
MSVEWKRWRRALASGRFGGARSFQIFAIYRLYEPFCSTPLETKHKKNKNETVLFPSAPQSNTPLVYRSFFLLAMG